MSARDSEFPQRVARLKSALGELVEETESISQRARRRNTGKIARVSTPILPRIDLGLGPDESDPTTAPEVDAGAGAAASDVDARAATQPPPALPPSTPPDADAARYSIVSPSTRAKKR